MINRIDLRNYKSFLKTSIDTRPLTILTGLNNSGKSSIIQAIRMVFAYYLNQNHNIELTDHISPRLQKSKSTKENYYNIDLTINGSDHMNLRVVVDGESYSVVENSGMVDIPNLQYLSAARLGPENILKLSPENRPGEIGAAGEYIIDYIDKNKGAFINERLQRSGEDIKGLGDNINAWLQYISPNVPLFYEIKREYNASYPYYGNDKILPTETGFGISYTLPMIASLLSPTGGILLLENPEGHLHPKGQASMGELIALAASTGKQLILETHSDHIINGIRVAVKEEKIDPRNVAILFLEKKITDSENFTRVDTILLDKNGSLSDYPDNFMDEWGNQLSKLI